ncbi:MAG: NAD(P)-dependent oxidoreductase [Deltaproteobacteria bacterium]|nr:NAD(P)-dependent oxidoreductase [Deltaproteobacteria bacterium]
MAFQHIGILSIGEMGYHWTRLLASRGVEVLTYAKDRSEVTRKRAENAGARLVPSLARLVEQSDLIVSVVVPFAARRVASKVSKALLRAGKKGCLYLDANAISPMTAEGIGGILAPAQASFVDGCIIGSAAKIGKGTVVYVSGPEAVRVQALEQSGFSVRVLGAGIGQASAFKIVYAGLTKGLQGLFVELLIGARKFGLLDEILQRYDESFPGLAGKVGQSIAALPVHAGRRAEEMAELSQTFRHNGLKAVMAPATQKILKGIASLNAGKASETGAREGALVETLELFFQKGLLQVHPHSDPLPAREREG